MWYTFRLLQLNKQKTALEDRRREMFANVAYPKPIEYKAAVVQTSGAGGNEVLDYIVRAEEIDARIEEIETEMESIRIVLDDLMGLLTEKERKVITLRFYKFESWPTIAREIYGEITEANIYKARKLKRNAEKKLDGELLPLEKR